MCCVCRRWGKWYWISCSTVKNFHGAISVKSWANCIDLHLDMEALHEYVHIHAYVYGIMHIWINLCMYRLVQNFLTHFTKSVLLNGGKDFNMLLTYSKWISPSLFVRRALISPLATRGAGWVKMAMTGAEKLLRCLSTQELSRLWLCSEDVGPT
jgi:hypothetical protein